MLLAKSHLYVRKLAFIQRLDLTSEQLTLTNISTRTRLFSRVSESRERTEGRKEENNAIVEKSRVRTLLPPHYVKVHTRASKKKKKKKMIVGKMLITESGHGEPDSRFGHGGVKEKRKE